MIKSDKRMNQTEISEKLERDLLMQYGPLLTGEPLRKALGYPSSAALRKAISRGTVPVPVFSIEKRRGKFALVKDVAQWLAQQRDRVMNIQ